MLLFVQLLAPRPVELQVALPVGTPGPDNGFQYCPDVRQLPVVPTFRKKAYGLQVSVVPAGQSLSAPIAGAKVSKPWASCPRIGRSVFVSALP